MSVLAALTLSGCGTFGTSKLVKLNLPPVPADLVVCFDSTVPAPAAGPMTKGRALTLIAALKLSEATKTACGQRLLKFYEAFL